MLTPSKICFLRIVFHMNMEIFVKVKGNPFFFLFCFIKFYKENKMIRLVFWIFYSSEIRKNILIRTVIYNFITPQKTFYFIYLFIYFYTLQKDEEQEWGLKIIISCMHFFYVKYISSLRQIINARRLLSNDVLR